MPLEQLQIKTFPDMETLRYEELKALRQAVELAYQNRVSIPSKFLLQKVNLGKSLGLNKDAKNGVFVDNPHLYPYLVKYACEKIGMNNKQSEKIINKVVKHETQHLIPIIGVSHIQAQLGLRFYRLATLPFLSTFQPVIGYEGERTLDEEIDLLTNVTRQSASDQGRLAEVKREESASKKFGDSKFIHNRT